MDDKRPDAEYVGWSKRWIDECNRVLKPGGAFFIYNIPKWNIILGNYLVERDLKFHNWIALSLTSRPPMPGRLYPSHYSLLYFSKGKPKTFRRIRTPIKLCRHCGGEIKDYGGYRDTMHPNVETGITARHVDLRMKPPGQFMPSAVLPRLAHARETHHQRRRGEPAFRIHHLFMAGNPAHVPAPATVATPSRKKRTRRKTTK